MKNKLKNIIVIIALLSYVFQSCTATKRDCRGKMKHRLSNGIYM